VSSACVTVDGGGAAASEDCNGFLGCEEEDGERGGGMAKLCWRGDIGDLFCAFLERFGTPQKGEKGEAEGCLSEGGRWWDAGF
jgi:hypothetical protein